jgi:hypothetical protein
MENKLRNGCGRTLQANNYQHHRVTEQIKNTRHWREGGSSAEVQKAEGIQLGTKAPRGSAHSPPTCFCGSE